MPIQKKMRDSNIELCRIISMLMIICHHAVVHGGALSMGQSRNLWIAYFFVPGGKICFDTFIAISCWFLVDQTFKANRFLKMWLETLFYSILTITAAALLGASFSKVEWISAFMPMTGGVQGYAQTYLVFYMFLPFLTMIAHGMTKKQNQFMLCVLSVCCFLFRFMSSLAWSEQSIYCRLILFIFIYFIMLYVKRYPLKCTENPLIMLSIFIIGWVFLYIYYYCSVSYPEWAGWKWFTIFVCDEGGILFLVTGLALFFFFNGIHIKSVKAINLLGSTTFAVILIHDGHFFRNWTWYLFKTNEWYYDRFFCVRIVVCAIVIYLICTAIDIIRKYCLEKPLFNVQWMRLICNKIDCIFIPEEK